MIAGRMRHWLEVYEPVTETDDFGASGVVWTLTATIHAERVKHTARRSEEVGEHFPSHTASYNVRSAHTVGENWRVKELGGNLYTVVAVVPNVERGYNTLECEKVNE